MANKISNFVFLILLFLLQSCSGGSIGNFLESSFMNINPNQISQNNSNKKLKVQKSKEDNKLLENIDKNSKEKLNDKSKPLTINNSSFKTTNDLSKVNEQIKNYEPKSYRIFVILKKVDPSFPTENFSKVLRNGNINFEIEKIELIPKLNQSKK